MIDGVPLTRGHTPYFIFGSNILFLAVIHLLDIAYLSEWLNHSETPFKMIKFRDSVEMTGTTYTGRI